MKIIFQILLKLLRPKTRSHYLHVKGQILGELQYNPTIILTWPSHLRTPTLKKWLSWTVLMLFIVMSSPLRSAQCQGKYYLWPALACSILLIIAFQSAHWPNITPQSVIHHSQKGISYDIKVTFYQYSVTSIILQTDWWAHLACQWYQPRLPTYLTYTLHLTPYTPSVFMGISITEWISLASSPIMVIPQTINDINLKLAAIDKNREQLLPWEVLNWTNSPADV